MRSTRFCGKASVDCKLAGASYMHPWQQWAIWLRKGDKELAMTLDR
eukprot:COSAG02_NODE_26487_length_631_cov_43.932331_1_plen_45_part_01